MLAESAVSSLSCALEKSLFAAMAGLGGTVSSLACARSVMGIAIGGGAPDFAAVAHAARPESKRTAETRMPIVCSNVLIEITLHAGPWERAAPCYLTFMGGTLSPEKDFGSLYGEENRCPHCGALSRALPDDDLRWVCGVCGGPRVLAKVKIGADGVAELKSAAKAKRASDGWRAASWLLGFGAAVALVTALVIGSASMLYGGGAVGAGILLAIVAATFSRSSRQAKTRARGHVDRAWEHAIGRLLTKRNDATAREIADELDVPEAQVEAALTTLSTQGRTRVNVDNDAELHYRSDDAPIPSEHEQTEQDAQEAQKRAKS